MWKKLSVLLGILIIAAVSARYFRQPLAEKFSSSSSSAVYDANHKLLRLTLSEDDKYRLWTPLKGYSPVFIEAILLHEDRHFYRHAGVNPLALIRAFYQTYFSDSRRIGGSTITMQLARLMYKIHSRSIPGKMVQILRAGQLELLYSKDEILEAYLNLIPFGRNVEGAAAASLIYFGKSADKLILPEALTLAVIPQSPALRAHGKDGFVRLASARRRLFKSWVARHPKAKADAPNTKDIAFVLDAPAQILEMKNISDLPFLAPHLTTALLAKSAGRINRTAEIHSTLDLDLQRILERQTKAYIARHGHVGVQNASALLVDYRTMEVKALLGSADFFNDEIQGQVNGTLAKRSPGSALKPFVYALALDQGLIHPMTVLKDAPLALGAFNPENFDGRFIGPLTAKEALIRSRNIPAVELASKLSSPNYYEFLKMAGISRLLSENHYGPSLVIGGFEVSMEEMATLYAALANTGVLRPLRYQATDPLETLENRGVRLLSAEASFMVMDMLKDTPRPEDRMTMEWTRDHLSVTWKTGTSYGFRDAWTAGIFGPYVLIVWTGNFNGEGNPVFVGLRAAAPLFFQMVDAIRTYHGGLRKPPPKLLLNLESVEVCAVSGGLPGAFCDRKKTTYFVPGKSPIQGCDVHRQVLIDTATGLRACRFEEGRVRTEVFEFWPSDVLKIFQKAGIPRRTPPEFGKECSLDTQEAKGHPPTITSPHAGMTYTLRIIDIQRDRQGGKERSAISFSASTDFDAKEVFWFVNDSYVGKAPSSGALSWSAIPGEYTVRAVDNLGRSDSRPLKVVLAQ